MENKKYTVCRDEIHLGYVITDYQVQIERDDNGIFNGNFHLTYAKVLRNILFIPYEKNKVNDLLYNSPHYKIYESCSYEDVLFSKWLVQTKMNLGPLLKYFGYDEYLYYQDIKEIRNYLFNSSVLSDHAVELGCKNILTKEQMNTLILLKDKTIKEALINRDFRLSQFQPLKEEAYARKLSRF